MFVCVTGATGFVGGHLLVQLFLSGAKVRAFYRNSYFDELKVICASYQVNFSELFHAVDWVKVDLLDPVSIDRALFDVKAVYHCAAVVSFDKTNKEKLLETNTKGTQNIVNAVLRKRIPQMCYISSIGALNGIRPDGMIDETCFENQTSGSIYSLSKHLSEEIVWQGIREGLNAVILNPGIILGPGLLNKGSLQLFRTVQKGLLFYTNGQTGYVDVRDVAQIARTCMEKELYNQRYVLVSENCSYKDLFSIIAEVYQKQKPLICAGKRMLKTLLFLMNIGKKLWKMESNFSSETINSAVKRSSYDSSLIKNTLNYQFKPFKETITDTCLYSK